MANLPRAQPPVRGGGVTSGMRGDLPDPGASTRERRRGIRDPPRRCPGQKRPSPPGAQSAPRGETGDRDVDRLRREQDRIPRTLFPSEVVGVHTAPALEMRRRFARTDWPSADGGPGGPRSLDPHPPTPPPPAGAARRVSPGGGCAAAADPGGDVGQWLGRSMRVSLVRRARGLRLIWPPSPPGSANPPGARSRSGGSQPADDSGGILRRVRRAASARASRTRAASCSGAPGSSCALRSPPRLRSPGRPPRGARPTCSGCRPSARAPRPLR